MRVLRRDAIALTALVVLAAALRLPLAAGQSLWFDEWATWGLMQQPFADMLRTVADSEATPALFYVAEWFTTRVTGTSDLGLRVLPLLAGLALVPVMYLLGDRVAGRGAGLGLAAVAAIHPWLVWLGAEARVYSLLLLLLAAMTLAFLALLERPGPRPLGAWVALAALLLATHHFAAFLVAAQGAWLFARRPRLRGGLALGGAALAAVEIAGLPVWARQRETVDFFAGTPVVDRAEEIVRTFTLGVSPPTWHLGIPAALLLAAALVLFALTWRRRGRAGANALALVGIGASALIVLGALDYVISRNIIGIWLVVLLVAAAGLASGPRPAALAVGAAAFALMGVATGALLLDERLRKADWEQAAELVGPKRPGLVVIGPGSWESGPLNVYLDSPRVGAAQASEIVVVGAHPPTGRNYCGGPRCSVPWLDPGDPGLPGVRLVERWGTGMWTLARFEADPPIALDYEIAGRFTGDDLPSFFDHSPGTDAGIGR